MGNLKFLGQMLFAQNLLEDLSQRHIDFNVS